CKITAVRLTRCITASPPLAGFLQLPDLALDEFSLDRAHLVEEYNAVTVVSLVQNATRGQLRGVNFKFISVCIPGPHDCSQTALDRRKDSGKREAAFFAILIAFGRQHHWINQSDALFGILTAGTVHYKRALR